MPFSIESGEQNHQASRRARREDERKTPRQRLKRLLGAMARRKRSKSLMKENDLVVDMQQQQQSDLFILPDDLLWNILLWSRPDDDDQYIWLWLCRVSGTCKVFRRLVCIEKKGGFPRSLLPTVFKLLPKNEDYLNEGPNHERRGFVPSTDTSFLRVELMEVIRQSSWMGSKLKCIHACDNCASWDETGSRSWPIAEELKRLVTSPCSPNLTVLEITHLDFPSGFNLVDEGFLYDLAQQHSGLKTLVLIGFGTPERDRLTPNAFARFAASMPNLQKVGLGDSHSSHGETWFDDGHLSAFLNNLNPSVTSLALDFQDFYLPTNYGIGNALSTTCPALNSLQVYSDPVRTRQLGRILQSKIALTRVDVSRSYDGRPYGAETNDEGVIDAIVKNQMKLVTFRAYRCKWFHDENLMRLFSFQIQTFGKVLVQTLGIWGTTVTPSGLRTALTRWRETDSGGSLIVEVYGWEGGLEWEPLVAEFPEVDFAWAKITQFELL